MRLDGIQHSDAGYPSLELRTHSCGSTLSRELPGSCYEPVRPVPTMRGGAPSADHVAQINVMLARAAKREVAASKAQRNRMATLLAMAAGVAS
jgi:hypothetical protein